MSKNKKIQAILPLFHPHVGGMEINSKNTYRHLVERGWDVEVITQDVSPKGTKLSKQDSVYGITVKRLNAQKFGYNPFTLGLRYLTDDIIVFHNFRLNPHLPVAIISLILKWLGLKKHKLILSAHGYFSTVSEALPQSRKYLIIYWIERVLAFKILRLAVDGVRAISHIEKRALVDKGFSEKKIQVIHNGLEDAAFDQAHSYKVSDSIRNIANSVGRYILQVSRIDKVKNLQTVLRALPKLRSNVKFLVGGHVAPDAYEYYEQLLDLADQLNIDNQVKYLGKVMDHNKFYLMRKATAFVQMSVSEGFGNSVLEAMSQGAVCIVSKGTGMEEIITDGVNGFCLNSDDSKGLAEAIDYIVENEYTKTIQDIKLANVKRSKDRSWRNVATELEQFYLRLQN